MSVNQFKHVNSISIAQTLPFPVLVTILSFVLEPDGTDPEDDFGPHVPEHGGTRTRWDSHEELAPFLRVCREWVPPGQHVLYRSVRIIGEQQADSYLRTVERRPELAKVCRSLVLGLERGPNGEDGRQDNGQGRVSSKLASVLELCELVQNVQLRPLHDSVGWRVSRQLRRLPLRTLVVAPRLASAYTPWTGPLFNASTLPITIPCTKDLELDTWVTQAEVSLPLSPSPPLALQNLDLSMLDIPDELLAKVIRNSDRLRTFSLYAEKIFDQRLMQDAFQSTFDSLREVSFICNPGMDELRHFTETGIVSATSTLLSVSVVADTAPPPSDASV